MSIKQIADELETRALNENIINKHLSAKAFNNLCGDLEQIQKENEKQLTTRDIEYLYNYIDISKYYY